MNQKFVCLIFSALFVSFVYSQTALPGIPTSDESIEDLVSAGVSETAAAGIVKFDEKFKEPFELEKTDPVAAKETIDQLHQEFNEYIKSLSSQDQQAYQQFIKDKNSRFV